MSAGTGLKCRECVLYNRLQRLQPGITLLVATNIVGGMIGNRSKSVGNYFGVKGTSWKKLDSNRLGNYFTSMDSNQNYTSDGK